MKINIGFQVIDKVSRLRNAPINIIDRSRRTSMEEKIEQRRTIGKDKHCWTKKVDSHRKDFRSAIFFDRNIRTRMGRIDRHPFPSQSNEENLRCEAEQIRSVVDHIPMAIESNRSFQPSITDEAMSQSFPHHLENLCLVPVSRSPGSIVCLRRLLHPADDIFGSDSIRKNSM